MKKFAVFDIDGTIFRWQLYHEMFDALVDEGIVAPRDARTVLTTREDWRKREKSYHDYEMILMDVMEDAIVGISNSRFLTLADQILKKNGHHVYIYTLKLLRELQEKGYIIIAISASHQQLVDAFCKLHAIDIAIGRKFQVVRGKVTGMSDYVHGRKHILLTAIIEQENLSWKDSYAIGDSGGDITMLELVEHPIAFNPNDELRIAAMQHGWPIVLERKSIAYRLEKGTDGAYLLADTIIG